MFWNKISDFFGLGNKTKAETHPYAGRHCWLYISSRYKEILFVPMGKVDPWMSRELDAVIVKPWPISIGELQDTIQATLDNCKSPVEKLEPSKDRWFSLKASKAKTQQSLKVDYVLMRLFTDLERPYAKGEVERIKVSAAPFGQSGTYRLTGETHLSETRLAQIVLDIFSACETIRTK
jgi:hypothetical protein